VEGLKKTFDLYIFHAPRPLPVGLFQPLEGMVNAHCRRDAVRRVSTQRVDQFTVKFPAAVAVPPGVFSVTLPVTAPAPTVAVTPVSELTVNVAFALPMVTLLVCFRLMPVIVTWVPTGPLVGLKLEIVEMTLYFCGVVRLPPGSNTVMTPVVAPAATAWSVN
jgi:hypothetical protein